MVVIILKWISQLFIVAVGIMALLKKEAYVIDQTTGKRSYTHVGKFTICSLLIGLVLFAATDFKERDENKQKDIVQKQQISNLEQVAKDQKRQLELSEGMVNSQQEQLSLSKELDESQKGLTESQQKQLSLSNSLVESQGREIKLSNSLIERQREQSLDRNLSEVEISFKPSAQHWSDISQAYEKIKSPVSGFSYSDATLIAERAGDHWNIDFTPVYRPEGSVLFIPVSTSQPDGLAFEDVIRQALVDFVIKWGNDLETEISPRGNYPSSVRVSQDSIAFRFRPPELKLSLSRLHADPTVTFRGRNYPRHVEFRSLDPGVMFDQIIDLNWKEKGDSSHAGRMMPYVSGPHHLNITFRTITP